MNITFKESPNFDSNRKPITKVVLHWFGVGTLTTASNRFLNPDSKVSAHYGVSGIKIYQWVKEEDVAWHCGVYTTNQCSIGIECDATTEHEATDETYNTIGELLADICKRNNIPLDREHIIGHNEVKATACPGTLDLNRIIEIAKGGFLNEDIPTEVEDKYKLKSAERYDKYWSYGDLIEDWTKLVVEASKMEDTIENQQIAINNRDLKIEKLETDYQTAQDLATDFENQKIVAETKVIECAKALENSKDEVSILYDQINENSTQIERLKAQKYTFLESLGFLIKSLKGGGRNA